MDNTFNIDNSVSANRMTPIHSNSPSTLKLGDPISEKFMSKSIDSSPSTSATLGSKKSNYILYALLVILLAILGINIFAYLGMLSDTFIQIFRPIIADIAYYGSETVKNTIDTSAEGSKLGIDVAAGTLTSAIDLGQKAASSSSSSSSSSYQDDDLEETVISDHNLKQSINNKKIKKNSGLKDQTSHKQEKESSIIPDNIDSQLQQTKPSKKAGYCYIGEDRGFRSCIKVSEQDTCMSGNIFPSQNICINPSLREGSED